MGHGKSYASAAVLVIAFVTALRVAMATEFIVGDATGWDFAPTSSFYSDWAAGLNFVPGDKIVFKYLASAHNVQEVTEAEYTLCNSVNPIAEYETGNDIITLPKPGIHYYICGFLGHCAGGGMRMRVTISASSLSAVSQSPPLTIEPPTLPSASPPPPVILNFLLPSPMSSIIPPPGTGGDGSLVNPPHALEHPPAQVHISAPGHSAGNTHLSMSMMKLLVVYMGVASFCLFC